MNKIQRTFLFALLICMILLTGCVSDNEQIKAPETLKITAELPENYPKALSKYKVDWYRYAVFRKGRALCILVPPNAERYSVYK